MPVFQFDLAHIKDTADLRVDFQDTMYSLQPQDGETRRDFRAADPVLREVFAFDAQSTFTHQTFIPDTKSHVTGSSWVRVVRPAISEFLRPPEVVLMGLVLADEQLDAYFRSVFQMRNWRTERLLNYRAGIRCRPRLFSGKLAWLGFKDLFSKYDEPKALQLMRGAQTLVTPLDMAAALVGHHPELASTESYTQVIVQHEHILPDPEIDPEQYNAVTTLAQRIREAGDSWSSVIACSDKDGNLLKAGYDIGAIKEGSQLYTYDIKESVLEATVPVVQGARRTVADDPRLQRKLWTRPCGTPVQSGGPAPKRAAETFPAASTDSVYYWTVHQDTPHHRLTVGTPVADTKGELKVGVTNEGLRTLYAGYQLYDEGGKPIGDVQCWGSVSAVNSILGIPVSTDPTDIELALEKAASVQLLFGSLGVGDWQKDVSWRGALLTGLWQYAIPTLFLAFGTWITNTQWFNRLVSDQKLVDAVIKLGRLLIYDTPPPTKDTATAASGLINTKKILTTLASVGISFFLQKGMEKVGAWMVEKIAAGEMAAAAGPVGWGLRLAAVALNVEQMAITTVEVLASPACASVRISRAIDVTLTLLPDPDHGEAGRPETAVWPAVARRYEVTLEYRGGTTRKLVGALPSGSVPLPLKFDKVPAGGEFRVSAGVYSERGWLAGVWLSDWMLAEPNEGSVLNLGAQRIKEQLVPLSPDTQYSYQKKIVYQDGAFMWRAGGEPPAATVASLDCEGARNLCDVVAATFNNDAYQLGYAWRGSAQHLPPDHGDQPPSDEQLYVVQNLSVLDDPDSRLRRTDVGLTSRPNVAYAAGVGGGKEIDPDNFILDPRAGGMHLRRVTLDTRSDFELSKPDLPSWGWFPLENIDVLAVHPSKVVLAVSWRHHKLMILDLPSEATKDAQAPTALLVSGRGMRQGLLQGPQALAVAPDGRILVLESLNNRVQAFDTKGNPVPCFTAEDVLGTVPTAMVAVDLDAGRMPQALQDQLVAADEGFTMTLAAHHAEQLDKGSFEKTGDQLIADLAHGGVALAYDPDKLDDHTVSAYITVVQPGGTWTITDPRGFVWRITVREGELWVYRWPVRVSVQVLRPGQEWLVLDHDWDDAWRLAPAPNTAKNTDIRIARSWFPLRTGVSSAYTYLDLAVEAKGYIYVLSRQGDGAERQNYVLHVYDPDGRFVFRTPDTNLSVVPQHIVAGRIALDRWRNVFAISYESLSAQDGSPQPTLAQWAPTPPLFSLPLTAKAHYDDRNIGEIAKDFAAHKIDLSLDAYADVLVTGEAWQVKDEDTVYHVYRVAGGLETYAVPA